MKALIIILSILLPLGILLFSRLRLSLIFDGVLRLHVKYLFLGFQLYPRKQRLRPKKQKKRAKRPKSGAMTVNTLKTAHKKEARPPLRFSDIRMIFRILRDVIGRILAKARRHVRLGVRHLRLTVGGEKNAARAAIEYGLAVQSAEYLFAYLESTGFFRHPENGAVSISVDFLSKDSSLDTRIDISCPFLFLFPLLFSSLSTALQAKRRWARHRAHAAKARAAKNNPSLKEQSHG